MGVGVNVFLFGKPLGLDFSGGGYPLANLSRRFSGIARRVNVYSIE